VEGVVIVGSILLAFGIDAWSERRREAESEREYLVALLADVEAVISVAERVIPLQMGANQVSDSIAESLWLGTPIADSSLSDLWANLGHGFGLTATLHVYEELIASGGVEKVTDSTVRRSLSLLQGRLDFNERIEGWYVESRLVLTPFVAELAGSQTREDLAEMAAAADLHRYWRESMIVNKREVLRAAEEASDRIEIALAALNP
jgi:hypothetical protein